VVAFALALWLAGDEVARGVVPVLGISTLATAVLVWKSVRDFSQTGPKIRTEILSRFRGYSLFALARLAFWLWMLFVFFGAAGTIAYATITAALAIPYNAFAGTVAAAAGIALAAAVQACRKLVTNPGLIVASW